MRAAPQRRCFAKLLVLQPTLGSPGTSCGYTSINPEHVEHSIVISVAHEEIGSVRRRYWRHHSSST
jgi:hypothetical protein